MLLLNNDPVSWFSFPGGEIQVKLPQKIDQESVILTWMPKDPTSIMLLQLTVNALYHYGISDITLECLYLPYARQDRVCAPGESLSVEVICNIFNQLPLTMIRLWDVHNWDAITDRIPHHYLFEIEPVDIFKRYKILDNFNTDNLKICAPDHGAYSRASRLHEYAESEGLIVLNKTRDPWTGTITGLDLDNDYHEPDNDIVLVVDDICDGGRTFVEAAKLLKQKGANKLYLYVTHGIFSNGLDTLLKHYEHIYCHHTFHPLLNDHERLTVLRKFNDY